MAWLGWRCGAPVRVVTESHERPSDDLRVDRPLRVVELPKARISVLHQQTRGHACLRHGAASSNVAAAEPPAGLAGYLILQVCG